MGNIKKIFLRDIKSLFRHPFALVIALGLCMIPALYAWFNIYSNWDPYGNTGNIQIAVASEDVGYQDEDGNAVNATDAVIDTLKENKSIDWVLLKSEKEALKGVRAGKYYAAVVFSKDFTECMYHGFLEGLKRPSATYYVNEKKNAVATKITDTAVSTLETNINEQYISLIVCRLFDRQNSVAENIDRGEIVNTVLSKLEQAKERTEHFSVVVKSLVQANDKLAASIDGAESDFQTIHTELEHAQENVDDSQEIQLSAADSLNLSLSGSQALQSVNQAAVQFAQAQRAKVVERKKAYFGQAADQLSNAKSVIDRIIDAVRTLNAATLDLPQGIVLSQLTGHSQKLGNIIAQLQSAIQAEDEHILEDTVNQVNQQIEALQQELQQTVSQSLTKLEDTLKQKAADVSQAVEHAKEDVELLSMVLGQGKTAVESLNQGFQGISGELDRMGTKLDLLTQTVNSMEGAQITEKLISFLKGNPDAYGAFFASPIVIETQTIYPVENYGSGVAPFYTTLALWVGGVVLVSLIKVKAGARGLVNPKPHELFLGRYLLFLVLALIQAAVTVWGDLYLLHIQCVDPRRFLLVAFLTSFTFSLLIYALTISFGDIGKAIIVVLMVIQIAGSSGTYPIEILPEFYQKMYIFFPFPYAINAMREAIAGMYEDNYSIYLIQLMIFAAAALLLGLVIRLPFRKFYQFVEKRMEDTDMM